MKNFDKAWRMFTWKFQKAIGNYSEYALLNGRKIIWNAFGRGHHLYLSQALHTYGGLHS